MNPKIVDQIFFNLEKEYNNSSVIELNHINNFTLLIAIILSAQSTDKGVNKATVTLFQIISTPEEMLNLGEEKLKQHIKTIGLYNNKAKNIIKLSKILVEKHGSQVPSRFEDLIVLPGVGRKTANVMLNCAFNKNTIGVDTHVFRVGNRTGLVKANNVLQTEIKLNKVIPEKWKRYINHWFVLHGRYVCTARKPKCKNCKIIAFCKFKSKNI